MRYLKSILPFIPPVLAAGIIMFFARNVPIGDQWDFIPTMEKMFNGTLTLQDVWKRHNEHNIFFPKIIFLILAYLSDWNIKWEICINYLCTLVIFLFGLKIAKRFKAINKVENSAIILLLSLVCFSFGQSENWLWGWQIQIFLSLITAIYGIEKAVRSEWKLLEYFIITLLGSISTFSFGCGIGFFYTVFLVLVYRWLFLSEVKTIDLIFWLIITAIVSSFYMVDFFNNIEGTTFKMKSVNYSLLLPFILSYLGSALLKFDTIISIVLGVFLVANFIAISIYIFKTKFKYKSGLTIYFIALFVLISAAITAVGRAYINIDFARAGRYVTISNFFLICIILFLQHFTSGEKSRNSTYSKVSLVVIYILFIYGNIREFVNTLNFGQNIGIAYENIISKCEIDENDAKTIFYDISKVDSKNKLEIIKERKLTFYQDCSSPNIPVYPK